METWRLVCQPWFIMGEAAIIFRLKVARVARLALFVISLHLSICNVLRFRSRKRAISTQATGECAQHSDRSRITRNTCSRSRVFMAHGSTSLKKSFGHHRSRNGHIRVVLAHPHELPPDAARFPQHPALPHLLRGPQGETQQAPLLHAGPLGRLTNQRPLTVRTT